MFDNFYQIIIRETPIGNTIELLMRSDIYDGNYYVLYCKTNDRNNGLLSHSMSLVNARKHFNFLLNEDNAVNDMVNIAF